MTVFILVGVYQYFFPIIIPTKRKILCYPAAYSIGLIEISDLCAFDPLKVFLLCLVE